MPRTPSEVTETELSILDVLWQRGPTAVRDIVENLYGQHSQSLHATVKSLLDRLADKGYVECDTSRFAHKFAATVDRKTIVGQQLQRLADDHFGGSLTPMLMTLVDRARLSRKQRDAIREIVDGIK
jgi:BlaI family penicillinase repressor